MPQPADAFYLRRDDGSFESTEHTNGPWGAGFQHAGPPSALLGAAMEQEAGLPLVRMTFEILRPVPVARLTVSTSQERGGSRVALVSGILSDGDGPCVVARAWGMRRSPVDIPVHESPAVAMPRPRETAASAFDWELPHDTGWHTAMELRFATGAAFAEPGPGSVWSRPGVAVVLDEPTTPLQRVLLVADAGNGVSAGADPMQYLFINTELTVHLHRQPVGEWVGIDAHSVYEPDGVGAAFSVIHDEDGPIGRGAQALLLDRQRP